MTAPPTTAEELRDWFRELKQQSGLSFAEIARAIDSDQRSVKRWMTPGGEPVIPEGDIVLKLLSALGVTFSPPAPGSVRPLNAQVAELRELAASIDGALADARATPEVEDADVADAFSERSASARLQSLEAKIDGIAKATGEGLDRLRAAIEGLAAELHREEPGNGHRVSR